MKHVRLAVWVGITCLAMGASVRADTLVLRDGRRVQGELVMVRDGVIEFEGQTGLFGRRERLRVDRADVARIELDERDSGRTESDDRRLERPSGLRERDVSVEAAVAWKDTGIDVQAGQTVYFSASGRVRWGPGRQDGPAGENNSPYNPQRPIPGRSRSSAGSARRGTTSSSATTGVRSG